MPELIFTATATNGPFYMNLVTRAHSEEGARLMLNETLAASTDEGGDYVLHDVVERVADADSDYDIGLCEYYSSDDLERLFISGDRVVTLASGGNG